MCYESWLALKVSVHGWMLAAPDERAYCRLCLQWFWLLHKVGIPFPASITLLS